VRPLPLALAAALLLTPTAALATPPLAGPVASPPVVAPAPPAPADPDPWLGRDKALHFAACATISGAAYGFGALVTPDVRLRVVFGAGAGILAGAGKELLDLAGLGDPSWRDFAWDVIGTVVGVGLAVALDASVRGLRPGQAY
jgi:putative lipoprotein